MGPASYQLVFESVFAKIKIKRQRSKILKSKNKMSKNLIIGIIVVLVVILGGIFYFSQQELPLPEGEGEQEEEGPAAEEGPQILNMAAIISSVDAGANTVMVKSPDQEKEIKLVLSSDTEILQLKFPFDPANPPAEETTFTPERIPISIGDLEVDSHVLVETASSLYGKSKIDDVVRLQVLP